MLPNCEVLADVGCDHGYLSVAVLESGLAKKAIAMDINRDPLSKAAQNIKSNGFSERGFTRLSDGLKELEPGEADVICICGMGGALIGRIIGNDIEVAKAAKVLVVEPQSEYYELRLFLMSEGFVIDDESLCMEENKIYPIIKIHFEPDSDKRISYTKAQLTYGPKIIEKTPELLYKLLDKNESEYSSILLKLEKRGADTDAIAKRCLELKEELELITQIRNSL